MPRRLVPLLVLVACTRTALPPAAPGPAPVGARRPALPAMPAVDGPLAIRVVYPRPDQVVTSRDSNFVFGSIGSGRATLRVNGAPAREGGFARVRLDRDLDVYVDTADLRDVPAGSAAERRVSANMKVRPSRDGVDLVIPIGTRAPYFVEEQDRAIVLTLYGVRANTDLVHYAACDRMVRTVE